MNKKLLTIAIALIIFAIVVAPVAAKMPAKNPWSSNNPCNGVWTFLQDLQNQIATLTTKVNTI
jgi:peptidoglycan hydrolase CwlO-like protein